MLQQNALVALRDGRNAEVPRARKTINDSKINKSRPRPLPDSRHPTSSTQSARPAVLDLDERHRSLISTYLRRHVRDEHLIDDLTQEVLLRAFRYRWHLRDPQAARVWLLRIAYHIAMDWYRREARSNTMESLTFNDAGEFEVEDPATKEDTAESGRSELPATLLRRALAQLPPRDRTMLIAHYFVGFSCRQISQRIGLSVANVKIRMYRARRQLRELLPEPKSLSSKD